MKIKKKLVSVVITTKNEEKHIANCLNSIFNQKIETINLEVIVVDNYSTDNTEKISRNFPIKFYSHGPERNSQRNFGLINSASGDYLVWIDADHIIHPLLLESCAKYIEKNEDVVSLMVPEVILGANFFAKVRRFERAFYEGTVIDGSRFIRACSFKSIGGFSNDWLHGPDDWDLDLKLSKLGKIHLLKIYGDCGTDFKDLMWSKYTIDTNLYPICKYHNESHLTLFKHLKKKKHYSTDFNKYINYWGRDNPIIKKQIGMYYRFIGVFFEGQKWRMVLKSPILYTCVIFNKILTGLIFYLYK